jgi:hypothetical protein
VPPLQLTTKEFLRRNFGALVAIGVIYAVFFAALVIARYARVKKSYAYME